MESYGYATQWIEFWITKGYDNILEGRRITPHGIVNIKLKKISKLKMKNQTSSPCL